MLKMPDSLSGIMSHTSPTVLINVLISVGVAIGGAVVAYIISSYYTVRGLSKSFDKFASRINTLIDSFLISKGLKQPEIEEGRDVLTKMTELLKKFEGTLKTTNPISREKVTRFFAIGEKAFERQQVSAKEYSEFKTLKTKIEKHLDEKERKEFLNYAERVEKMLLKLALADIFKKP